MRWGRDWGLDNALPINVTNKMIPLGQNKILFRFARLLAVLQTLHKSHPTIKLRDKSHPTILIPAMRIPSFALLGSLFGGTNFSHVIVKSDLTHAYRGK